MIWRGGAWLVLLLILSSCGWQLRGMSGSEAALPPSLQVISSGRYAPLNLVLLQQLRDQGVDIYEPQPKQATSPPIWQLHLGQERQQKRSVAVDDIGSASQYELSIAVDFQFINSQRPATGLPLQVSTSRIFDFDANNTSAKAEEETALFDEMRQELAQRILQAFPRDLPHNENDKPDGQDFE